MSSKTLLEVDDSIMRNNLLLTEKKQEDEEFDDLFQSLRKPEPPSVVFRPLPGDVRIALRGACVKCKTESGKKVFLNICHTTHIPPPEDISEEKLFEVLNQETPSWCIPMSIGHERFEGDKGGSKCLTYDIAVNTKFFEKCQDKAAFWAFTILTIITAVGEKHGKSIDSTNYVILKKRKVLGTLHDHRAQKREPKKPTAYKPLIQEMPGPSISSSKPLIEKGAPQVKAPTDPQYVVFCKLKEGEPKELISYFKLPNSHRIKDIRVDVCQDRIIVEAPGKNYLVDVFVPHTLNQENATAVMDQNVNILRLNIPVM